jgi:hypothetical protein
MAILAVIPFVTAVLHVPDSHVEYSSPEFQGQLRIVVTNSGDRAAVLTELLARCEEPGENDACALHLEVSGNFEERIISPGAAKPVAFSLIRDMSKVNQTYVYSDVENLNLVFNKYNPITESSINNMCTTTLSLRNFRSGDQQILSRIRCRILGAIAGLALDRLIAGPDRRYILKPADGS